MKKILYTILLIGICVLALQAQSNRQITGKVQDGVSGIGLPGVSISVKGTTKGTTSDQNGFYSIEIADNSNELVFSFIGYKTETVPVGTKTAIDITLQVDLKTLEEVVIIGYGEVKKSNVTGAIVSVKQEDLKKIPATNVMESLQGKMPGVDITRNSGSAGSGVNVTIRGNRSLGTLVSNDPLYIVDGIQYPNIQDLNPNDIQSMEVLKDAASTAVYGSRGANGVILITTKRGATGKTKISFNSYAGISEAYGYPKVANAEQYKAFRKEAFRAANQTDVAVLGTADTDWQNEFLKAGMMQDYQLGISAGNEKTNMYLSFDFFREDGLFKLDFLNRYSIRANIDHSISKIFKVGTQNQITYYDQSLRTDPLNTANQLLPLEAPYDANGVIIPILNNGRTVNPLMDEQPDNFLNNIRTSRIFTSAYVEAKPVKGLTLRSNLGFTLTNARNGLYANSLTVLRNTIAPYTRVQNDNSINYNWENIVSYANTFGNHSFTLTGVYTLLSGRNEFLAGEGQNQLLTFQQFYALGNANSNIATSSGLTETGLVSYTGRLLYNFKEKYLFTFTGRTDGASQLTNKWAFFPSASFAWRVIEEGFLANNKVLSDLKLRVSYGTSGTSGIPAYSTQTLLTRVPYAYDETPAIGYTFGRTVGNDNISWEISSTYNLGLDFAILKNRIVGTIDAYQTDSKNLLQDRLIPLTSGFERITQNIGKSEVKGLEIGLNAVVIDKTDFNWKLAASWFTAKEKIVELANNSNDVANGLFIGQPTQSFYDYEKVGIWQTAEADAARTFNQLPGDIRVKDQNSDGVIDSNNDRIILGSVRPKWTANLNSDIKFKGFDFGVQLFARWGQMMRYAFVGNYDPQANTNSLVHDYWTPENPTNDFPRPNATRSQSATAFYSTLFYKDASFFKIRGLTLGYTLPSDLLSKIGIASIRVYATGRNLWTISKVDNYDPERGGALTSPMTKLWVGGINIEF